MNSIQAHGPTVRKIDEIESLIRPGIFQPLQPKLRSAIRVSPESKERSEPNFPQGIFQEALPMEHNPLGHGDNALLRLIQG